MNRLYERFLLPGAMDRRPEKDSFQFYPLDVVRVSGDNFVKRFHQQDLLGLVELINYDLHAGINFDNKKIVRAHTSELEGLGYENGMVRRIEDLHGLKLYILDRVLVRDNVLYNGRKGTIMSLGLIKDSPALWVEIMDDEVRERKSKLIKELEERIARAVSEEFDEGAFLAYKNTLRQQNPKKFMILERNELLMKNFKDQLEARVRQDIKEKEGYEKKLRNLDLIMNFYVASDEIELIERFPPNDLYLPR